MAVENKIEVKLINEPTVLKEDQLVPLCGLGQCVDCCKFLQITKQGFCCAKGSRLQYAIMEGLDASLATGDRCSGPPNFIVQAKA